MDDWYHADPFERAREVMPAGVDLPRMYYFACFVLMPLCTLWMYGRFPSELCTVGVGTIYRGRMMQFDSQSLFSRKVIQPAAHTSWILGVVCELDIFM